MIGEALEADDAGKYSKEERIHSIICPMQVSSDDVRFDDMKLSLFEVRKKYLKTFEGLCFIPLAIQNVSSTQDSNIRVVVNVEAGEIVDPDEYLICDELEGMQGMLFKDDDDEKDAGIIAELFTPPIDDRIRMEERPWYPQTPNIPIYTGHGFQQPDKTEEDYKLELEEFIASSYGLGFYEFDVETLRPGECRWLSTGMLIKPSDSGIRVNYRICSDHSSGDLNGKLIWLSSET